MEHRCLVVLRAVGWTALLGLASAAEAEALADPSSTSSSSPDFRFVPDVELAFSQLARRPEALAFTRADSPEAGLCKHYQGMARWNGPDGTPYVFLTKSGNVPNWACGIGVDTGHGYLIVARMGSRDTHGERLRSNLWPFALTPASDLPEDVAIHAIALDGTGDLPGYRHPGGMQIVDGVLAIGAEIPVFASDPRAAILFFDVADPEQPRFIKQFDLPDLDGSANAEFGADPVGVTPIRAPDGSCCRYLMIVVGGPENKEVRFFRSKADPGTQTTDLRSENLDWEQVGYGTYSEAQLETPHCLGVDWPTGLGPQHQMLNLVRQGDLDGPLYLVGGRNETIDIPLVGNVPFGDELTDLYEVNLWDEGSWVDSVPGPCPFTHVNTREVGSRGHLFYDNVANFAAASGTYVSPSGELMVYASTHQSSGGGVFFGEYRHFRMVRSGSPTLHPTASLGGSYSVDEGSSTTLTGQGEHAITQAWMQAFSGGDARHAIEGSWLPIDYRDREGDDIDELDRLGAGDSWSFAESASSWLWFAPQGCTISANDYPRRSTEWPGPGTLLLHGTGEPVEATSLGSFDDDMEGLTFYHQGPDDTEMHDCDDYYAATISLSWDLDNNGSFESGGSSVPFSAAALDGPATASAQARAQHPTDPSPLGTGAPVPFTIAVRNVAPTITSVSVQDSLGHDVAGGATPPIVGLPVRLDVRFTDPGRPDTHAGYVSWGDGSADTSFDAFSHATNGAVGSLQDAHVFGTPGSHGIVATITDDDNGATSATVTIEVLSLEDAIEEVVDELNNRIATATNPRVAAALRAARDELIGNLGGNPPTNGALDKLDAGDPVGAITKLQAAIGYLITAEARGAGSLTSLKDLLGLAAEAIATIAYHDAEAGVTPPSSGEQRILTSIRDLIARGHLQLSLREHLKACDSFRQATQKALDLG